MPRPRLTLGLIAAIAAAHLWLVSAVPIRALPDAAHDDGLFARLAVALLKGDWLGAYDQYTLAKGPVYPMWLAANAWLGTPLTVAQAAAYLLAGALVCAALAPLLGRWWLVVGVFAAYAANPMVASTQQLRVIREGLYAPLTVLVLALALWWWRWRDRPPPRRAALAVLLGALLAAYWMTREESAWIVPALALVWGWTALAAGDGRFGARRLGREAALAVVALAVAWAGTHVVAAANQARYGVRETVEFRQDAFLDAYGALSRIEHAAPRPLVVVPADALARAAAASPAAAEIAPLLDGAIGASWAREGCRHYRVDPCDGDIRGGWFMWALRDAVADRGHYRSATEARGFYRRLADEIDTACAVGQIPCSAPRSTMAPPFRAAYVWPAIRRFADAFARLVSFHGAGVEPVESGGRALDFGFFADLVGGPVFPRARAIALRGRVVTDGVEATDIGLALPADSRHWYRVERASPQRYAEGKVGVDFDLETDCVKRDCRLVARSGDQVLLSVRFDEITDRIERAGATLYVFDYVDSIDGERPSERRSRAAMAVVNALAAVFRAAGPAAAVVAGLCFLAAAAEALWRRRPDALVFITIVLLALVITRLALLSYMDVVALPSINSLYMSPAVPAWLLFLVLAPVAGARALARLRTSRKARR